MTNTLSKSVAVIAVALAITTAGACRNSTASSEDVLAQDTTLSLEVAVADQDTASQRRLEQVTAARTPAAGSKSSTAIAAARAQSPRSTGPSRSAWNRSLARLEASRRVKRSRRGDTRRVDGRSQARASERVATSGFPGSRSRTITRPADRNVTESGNTVTVNEPGSRAASIVSAGAELALASEERICSSKSNVGDRFSARLSEPVVAADGAVIPTGATAIGEITWVGNGTQQESGSGIGLHVASISFSGKTYPLTSQVTYTEVDRVRTASRSNTARKVGTGAAVGAVLGQVFGRNAKSMVIGAAGGAVGGAVLASRTTSVDQCVPDGGRITAQLTKPLMI